MRCIDHHSHRSLDPSAFVLEPQHPGALAAMPTSASVKRFRGRRFAAMASLVALTAAALVGCSGVRTGGAVGSGSASGTGGPDATARPAPQSPLPSAGGAPTDGALPTAGATPVLPPPTTRARNWPEYQRLAARRLLAANPTTTYMGVPPEPLLAIPVIEVELNGNGTVRRVNVMRMPSQATDTVQLAVNAIYRAAPFGDVSHLPRPWKFSEVFLFDDNRRFKPRSLE